MIEQLSWDPVDAAAAKALAARAILPGGGEEGLGGVEVAGRRATLPFYPTLRLYGLRLRWQRTTWPELFVLAGDEASAGALYVLDGSSAPVYAASAAEELALTGETAPAYLRFFCFAVRGDDGPFLLFEEPRGEPANEREQAVAGAAQPLAARGRDDDDRFRYDAVVVYDGGVFQAHFAVAPGGHTTMLDDEPLLGDVAAGLGVLPSLPPLLSRARYRALLHAVGATAPSGVNPLRVLVGLLLERALAAQAEARLLAHFNARQEDGPPLDRFAQMVATTEPVIALESVLPFVEESAAQVVEHRLAGEREVRWVRPDVDAGDDTRLRLQVPRRSDRVVLLPFHSYRGLVDAERVAHEIAARDIPCLIGCERVGDLPASLREVVDLTLTLPRLDAGLFAELFERVMGSAPPPGWEDGGAHWVTHVHHADFQHPRGLELGPDEALAYVRDRARQRLRDVEPVGGLGVADLHGMAEARAFAEDLITDVHEALAGRLAWAHVDRGVLLAGPPGTGKTTLARAIAKDSGVRFIGASAAGWQAAGHLGDHIRALRADFARARRFAPAILFLDEVDSIGSRERFSGRNTQYSVQVVNALLEQLQGMDDGAPVIVIAATNYADRVDPALRRAGRLDRTIEIPHPSSQSLAAIFGHYLDAYVGAERADDVDLRALGGLAFGLTGADVELFVRGALRRARRAGRPVCHADLVAEVTRKPRDPAAAPRLTPEEVRRVAVHEAGHALAALLGAGRGADLAYVSIVPRADGTLGFVARMPSERVLVTRAEYVERLEVMLAGRAAEAVVFGADGVTSGARGDLRVATRSALLMTSQYGLGPGGGLLWSETPSPEQRAEAGRVLQGAYASVLDTLRAHEGALSALAEALEERQELTGEAVRTLIAAHASELHGDAAGAP